MDKEKKETIFAAIIFAAVALGAFFLYKNIDKSKFPDVPIGNATPDKESQVLYIMGLSGGQGSFQQLMALDDLFIAYWYSAIKTGQKTFSTNGKTFDSVTGKQIS